MVIDAMRVLVAYATRHGATAGIAERVAAALTAAGLSAEARPVEAVKDVEPYDAVVLGGAAYMFHWLKPAVTFCRRHRKELAARPVWLFSSGPLGTDLVDKDGKDVLETSRPRSSMSSLSCCTRGVSRSSSAPSTRTRRRSVWASALCSTCLPCGLRCRPVTFVTGRPLTPGQRRSPRSWGPVSRHPGYPPLPRRRRPPHPTAGSKLSWAATHFSGLSPSSGTSPSQRQDCPRWARRSQGRDPGVPAACSPPGLPAVRISCRSAGGLGAGLLCGCAEVGAELTCEVGAVG